MFRKNRHEGCVGRNDGNLDRSEWGVARSEVKSQAMKELLALLNAFDENDPRDLRFFQQLLGQILEEALPELSDRLVRPSTSRALKRLIMASPAHYPHPEWTPVLLRALLHESDADLFEDGCRGLVQIGGMAETDALRQVARQRQEPVLQAIVARKLAWLEPRQPFGYHFQDLLLGGQNPRLSQQAAQHLSAASSLDHLEDLQVACDHPDNMVCLLALKVISAIQHPRSGWFLMERFSDACGTLLLDNQLRAIQEQIRRAPAQSVKNVVLDLLRSCPGAAPFMDTLAEIEKLLEDPAADALPLVQRLRPEIQGIREVRLVDCLADLALGHSVRLTNLMPEPLDEIRQRTQRLQSILDACAEGLAMFARRGTLEKGVVLPLFQRAYEGGAGGDGFGRSFAELLDEGDKAQMDLILHASNHHWREEGIKVFGERASSELIPFFMEAMSDPIVDNAQLATRYFGKMPGAFETALALFRSDKVDQVERAIEIFSLNGMVEAGPFLVEYLEHAEREDLVIAVIKCLGALKYQPAEEVLDRLLRYGLSPRLAGALAEGLVALTSVGAARRLLGKAKDLRNPEILLLALAGIFQVRPGFQQSLAPEEAAQVEQVLEACFGEGGSCRLRAIEACSGLWALDAGIYERLEDRIAAMFAEQAKRPTWDRDQQQLASAVMRDMQRKRKDLEKLAAQGSRVRELAAACVPGDVKQLRKLARALEEPGLVLGFEARGELEAMIGAGLVRPGTDQGSLEILCGLAGLVRGSSLREPLEDLLLRCAPHSRLHAACAGALNLLGEGTAQLPAAPGRQDVLVLDPSAFFRKRILGALQGHRVREARDRAEAEAMLQEAPADLLISESADASGDLQEWFVGLWQARRIRQIILSTNSREALEPEERPWLLATLFKPFPMEDLLALVPEIGAPPAS